MERPVFCASCFKSLASGFWLMAKYDFIVRSWWCLKDVRMRFVRWPLVSGGEDCDAGWGPSKWVRCMLQEGSIDRPEKRKEILHSYDVRHVMTQSHIFIKYSIQFKIYLKLKKKKKQSMQHVQIIKKLSNTEKIDFFFFLL